MDSKAMRILMRILDLATNMFLISFALIFALIGLVALFLLIVEGDIMNIIGVMGGFVLAWMCWSVRIRM